MARRGIEVRFETRKQKLSARMLELAESAGGELVPDEELLDKLTAICAVPGIVMGQFDPDFLALPREVLVTSLRDHQSAFTVESNGKLMPCFLTVMDRADDPAGRIQAGNEWVVEARLADARFFYDEDRKRSLGDRLEDLEQLTFHARLGSYADKARRIAQLAEVLCQVLGWEEELEAAKRAALLLKVDLTTEMVKEFTSLQGIMGGVYARQEKETEQIWQAIYDHYLPASGDDPIPRGRVGRILSLADRIDTLVGIFGLGLIPTGSRDPFGLRRAAQGVVRIVLEGELPLDLDLVAARAVLLYGDRLDSSGEEILTSLRPFLHDRVRHLLGSEGYAYDSIEAALAVSSRHLPDLKARVEALQEVREEASFLSVVLAAKRIANIIKDAPDCTLDATLFREATERELHDAAQEMRAEVEAAEAAGEYERCFRRIADLAEVLDRFFVEVLVMDENRELRFNRIALLQSIQRILSRTARLTEVVVDKAEHRKRGEAGGPDVKVAGDAVGDGRRS
jgi:glycyl-tRNA synthetase beta chain